MSIPPTATENKESLGDHPLRDASADGAHSKLSRVCWLLILFKVVYLGCVCAALLIWPMDRSGTFFHSAFQRWTPDKHLTFASHFGSWDAEHYLYIAAHGYVAGQGRCAFYPLFPLAVRGLSVVTGGHELIAGMVLANIFSLAGEMFFFVVVRKRLGERVAWLSLALLLAFPGLLFFQFIYTEGLFLLLVMLLVYSLDEDRLGLACIAAFLLPLTRAVGIFSIVPIFWHLFFKTPSPWLANVAKRTWLSKKLFEFVSPRLLLDDSNEAIMANTPWDRKRYALLLAPFYGWALYFFQMWARTGNAFEGFEAQKQWGIQSMGNIFHVQHFVASLFSPTSLHEIRGSALDRCSFILLVYCLLIMIWRLDKGWFLWAVLLGVVPAMSGTFVSYTRFASVVFPMFVTLGVFLNKLGLTIRYFRVFILLAFGSMHIIILWRFVNYRWAG